jgi:glutathione synthase/RimK-type ligase-like ATP-grasp enzyme
MAVLILGDPGDPHVAKVSSLVQASGGTPLVFHRFLLDHNISLNFDSGEFSAEFSTPVGVLRHEYITSVWFRVKPVSFVSEQSTEQSLGQEFSSKEWGYVLQSLPTLLSHASWINDPIAQQRVANKPYQLSLAQRVGLKIPRTRITNSPNSVLQLFEQAKDVAYKTLANFVFPPDEYIFTTRITQDAVTGRADAIKRAPGIFQEYVQKAYELRVTVVGDEVFATKIHSQNFAATQTDWRRSQLEAAMYEPTDLPASVQDCIHAFHREAGLFYGAYDFIVSPEGTYVFLECNPAGQWLWHEEQTGKPICSSMAKALVAGKCAT